MTPDEALIPAAISSPRNWTAALGIASDELRASLLRWQVLDICLRDTAGIPTDRRLVYGRR
jgi:hypothetical protein